jgi:hypothetical protein
MLCRASIVAELCVWQDYWAWIFYLGVNFSKPSFLPPAEYIAAVENSNTSILE